MLDFKHITNILHFYSDFILLVIFLVVTALFIYNREKTSVDGTSEKELDDWSKKNSQQLYSQLRFFGYYLEVLLVGLGIYTALSNGWNIGATMLYFLIVSVSEITKLQITESIWRYPSFLIMIIALPALCISIFFTSESLIRVTGDISDESHFAIVNNQINIQTNQEKQRLTQAEISSLNKQLELVINNHENSIIIERDENVMAEIKEEIKNLLKSKNNIITKNNQVETKNLNRRISEHKETLTSIYLTIERSEASFNNSLKSIRLAKFQELDQSPFFTQGDVRTSYNDSIDKLRNLHNETKEVLQQDVSNLRVKLDYAIEESLSLIPITQKNINLISEIDSEVHFLKSKENELKNKHQTIITEIQEEKEKIGISKKMHQNQIMMLKDQSSQLVQKLKTLKTEDLFYSLASIYYAKEATEVKEEEVKDFIKYFIGLSAFGLALMPIFLISISVEVEKNLNKRAKKSNFIEFSYNLKSCFHYISESLKRIVVLRREKIKNGHEIKMIELKKKSEVGRLRRFRKQQSEKKIEKDLKNLKEAVSQIMSAKDFERKGVLEKDKATVTAIKEDIVKEVIEKVTNKVAVTIDEKIKSKKIVASITNQYYSKQFFDELLGRRKQYD